MTQKNFTQNRNYKTEHTTFGGLIFPSDFNTDHRGKNNKNGSPIASRIISDKNFDNRCKQNRNL